MGDVQHSAKLCHTFKCGKESNIHSLSLNIDKENFLSSDDKGVFLWNLNKANRANSYNLVDFRETKDSS